MLFLIYYHASAEGKKRVKTDKRDAALIARCIAHHDYSPVHIPTEQNEQTKEYIRMRNDHKLALKKIKQQILSFCLRHNYRFDSTANYWIQAHLKWLKSLKPEGLYAEILQEYILTYDNLTDKLERFDKRIEELASGEAYRENVRKLSCFIDVKTVTALAVLTEVGDFKRFASAQHFASDMLALRVFHTKSGFHGIYSFPSKMSAILSQACPSPYGLQACDIFW